MAMSFYEDLLLRIAISRIRIGCPIPGLRCEPEMLTQFRELVPQLGEMAIVSPNSIKLTFKSSYDVELK